MALNWSTTELATENNGVKALIYGPAGMGKTMLSATAPSPLLISAEAGTLSLKRKNIERVYGPTGLPYTVDYPVLVVKTLQDLADIYYWCAGSHEAKNFQTICLDSLSEIAEQILANAKPQVKDPRQAYAAMMDQMGTFVRSYRDLPGFNVYMSAKMEPHKDEMSGITKYLPSMPGQKLGPQLPYFFDEVFRLGVGKTPDGQDYRFLQTQPCMQYEAKDRSGSLAEIEYPHLTSIFNKINGA